MNWPIFLISVLSLFGIFAIMTVALDLQFGYGNMVNFGIVGYVAAGAYTYVILTTPAPEDFDVYKFGFDLPVFVGIIGAIVAGLIFAALTAWPVLRLRGDYLAIMTLAFAEVVNVLLVSEDWLTNGLQGFSGVRRPLQDGGDPDRTLIVFAVLVFATLAVSFWCVRRLVSSAFGRTLLAVSDDETGAAAIGKDVGRYRLNVFLVGGGIMGASGALYAMYLSLVTPETLPVEITFTAWIALVLGGVRRVWGPLVGVVLLLGFQETLRFLASSPEQAGLVASTQLALTGLLLILVLKWRPPTALAGGRKHPGRLRLAQREYRLSRRSERVKP